MITTYHLSANDLTADFLKSLRTLYKGKTISITVEAEMDETEYLLASPANRKHLEEALKSKEGFEVSADSWAKYRKSKNAKDLSFKKVSLK